MYGKVEWIVKWIWIVAVFKCGCIRLHIEKVATNFRILHDNGFTEEEIIQQRAVVHNNTVTSMYGMLIAMDKLDIPLENLEREVNSQSVDCIITY